MALIPRSIRPRPLALLLCLGIGVGLILPAPVSAGGNPDESPCRAVKCTSSMPVTAWSASWRSAQSFYPHNEAVLAKLIIGPKPLKLVSSWGPGGCRHLFRGSKVEARVKACGSVTPLYVRAVREYPLAVTMRIVYRADPSLDEGPSPGGGVFRSGRMSRIAGPES